MTEDNTRDDTSDSETSSENKTVSKQSEFTGVQQNNEAVSSHVNNQLIGIPNKKWYYIGQVSSNSTNQMVIQYIREKANMSENEPVIVTQLQTKGNTKSFKVGVQSKHSKELESKDFWPPFVSCRNFVFRRQGLQNSNNNFNNNNFGNRRSFFLRNRGNHWRQ